MYLISNLRKRRPHPDWRMRSSSSPGCQETGNQNYTAVISEITRFVAPCRLKKEQHRLGGNWCWSITLQQLPACTQRWSKHCLLFFFFFYKKKSYFWHYIYWENEQRKYLVSGKYGGLCFMEGLSHPSHQNLQFFQLIGEIQETAVIMFKRHPAAGCFSLLFHTLNGI